ncbi:Hypothetical protein PHPALM_12745 [Phytophthora palmivora]|uniref:M96 mating-specific protein family n=1 Tax=Phytophthora palmivora TaxID=4796 RepID=A0A2P4XZ48_9STRA|nr:Hypothetical protein PHPALM_12745 [Phytophthora palmivora]
MNSDDINETLEILLSERHPGEYDSQRQISPPSNGLTRCHSLEFLNDVNLNIDGFTLDTHVIDQRENETLDVNDFPTNLPTSLLPDTGRGQDSASKSDDSGQGQIVLTNPENSKRKPRLTPKERIGHLRQSVEQLTRHLSGLIASRAQQARSSVGGKEMTTQSSKDLLWKRIAARQLLRRRKAEQDNAQLRAILQVQMEEARNLKHLMKRRTKTEVKMFTWNVSTGLPDSSRIFQKMLQDSDELLSEIDILYVEKGMHNLQCPGHKQFEERNMVGDGVYLEIMHQNLVPFTSKKTEKSVWACLSEIGMRSLEGVKDYNKEVSFHAQHSEESNNTMVTNYFAATSGVPAVSGAQVQKVLRKYVEENRVVFICQTLMEPKLVDNGASIGVQFYTKLAIVVEKATSLDGSHADIAKLQLYFSAARRDFGTSVSAAFCKPGTLDTSIAAWEDMICRVPDAVESFLVDEAVSAFSTR